MNYNYKCICVQYFYPARQSWFLLILRWALGNTSLVRFSAMAQFLQRSFGILCRISQYILLSTLRKEVEQKWIIRRNNSCKFKIYLQFYVTMSNLCYDLDFEPVVFWLAIPTNPGMWSVCKTEQCSHFFTCLYLTNCLNFHNQD